ncbi:MAG: 7-carboxy-7-deazaguanine synthase [Proteobacteria bacterium]|nr:7-carboxy-7-deazaguanine synthase [Pseudomonadota bacterium]MDA1023504.1 7-carboxy-7-deazaguanine synthase [Pseudomonadota bacterium]
MVYSVKEIYYTLQGEGVHTGRPAVFCRFAGCNLWTGREVDRAGAECSFCDTDFVGTDGPGGGRFKTAAELARAVRAAWPDDAAKPFIVCTGGEPLLQLDDALLAALHEQGFEVAVETNGTQKPPPGLDWICVSPKAGCGLAITEGDELKLVYPQSGADPAAFEKLTFRHFLLQPMDGPDRDHNTQLAIDYCRQHPQWRLSLQSHKYLRIP